MVIKINYTSSDVYVSTSVSPVYVVVNYSGTTTGAAVWGQITGTLSNQTDLQTALDDKVPYTGATATVDLGDNDLEAGSLLVEGTTGTGGALRIKQFASSAANLDGYNTISTLNTGVFYFTAATTSPNFKSFVLNPSGLTDNTLRTYTLPNLSGTLALLSDIPSLTGYVPYTGATTNVNLGEFELKAGQMTLDTSPTGTAAVGTTRWNDTNGVSETTLKGGSVILKNGVDLVARVVNKVTPNTTLTKAGYAAVRVSGAQGQRLAVAYAQANNDANSADTLGLVTETIATNQEGFIMTVGQIEDINTTGSLQGETWVDGDVLYLSPTTPGAITKVKPTGNGHIVVIGYVEYAHANHGKIYVKVMNGWELDELHDVAIVSPANNEALIYESATSLWKNKTIASALGYTPISGTGTSGQVAYWNGTSSQTGSNNLFWNNANANLGIGSNAVNSVWKLGVDGNLALTGFLSFGSVTGSSSNAYIQVSSTELNIYAHTSRILSFYANAAERARITTGGNFLLNTTTDSGQRLQVMGDTYLKGSGSTSATTGFQLENNTGINLLTINNSGFYRLSGSNGLFISMFTTSQGAPSISGTNTQFYNYTTTQAATFGAFSFHGDNFSQTSGSVHTLFVSKGFYPTSGTASQSSATITPAINQTGGANGITRGLYVNPALTSAADWRSIEWSNNSGWGLYGAGTANNYLGGNLGVGVTPSAWSALIALQVGATASLSGFTPTGEGMYLSSNAFFNGSSFIYQTSAFASQYVQLSGIHGWYNAPSGTAGNAITFTQAMTLTAGGRLGLGTTAPDELLELSASENPKIRFVDVGNLDAKIGIVGSTAMGFEVNGSERLRITSGGNLLVGTTTDAGEKFQVNGTARVSGQVTGDNFVPTSSTIPTNGMYLPSANTLGFASGTSSRMVITSTGAVGVGTTSPLGLFEVKGDGASYFTRGTKSILLNPNVVGADTNALIEATSGMALAFGTGGSERMRINASGNVGIGTTSASTRLVVNQSADNVIGFNLLNPTGRTAIFGYSSTFQLDIGANNNDNIRFGNFGIGSGILSFLNNGTEAMRVTSVGNLLVGTTTDSGYKLDINGTARVSGNLTVDTNTLFVDAANDKVGIGTTTPSEKLHLAGANVGIDIDGTTSSRTYYNRSGSYVWSTGIRAGDTKYYIYDERVGARLIIDDSGNVGIGTTSPSASAILQADSTTKGFLPPRMTNAQRTAISSPAVGLIVYCTDMVEGLYVYKSTGWTFVI